MNTDDTDLHGSGNYVSLALLLNALESPFFSVPHILFAGLKVIVQILFFNWRAGI